MPARQLLKAIKDFQLSFGLKNGRHKRLCQQKKIIIVIKIKPKKKKRLIALTTKRYLIYLFRNAFENMVLNNSPTSLGATAGFFFFIVLEVMNAPI